MEKMKFGEWVGACIAGHSGAKVVKVANSYFDTEALVEAARQIDTVVWEAQMEQRKLTRFESVMVEILFDLAGWKDLKTAQESYQRYLNKKIED